LEQEAARLRYGPALARILADLASVVQMLWALPKRLLELASLILGVINGWFLLKFYLRDRPRLKVKPVSPGFYQWWFRMPDDEHDRNKTRRYNFLVYVDIVNKGLRKTELESWWLSVQTEGQGRHRLNPINMPEPKVAIGKFEKHYPVLGQRGINSGGSTLTEPGCSTPGMVFFEYECYGSESWDPAIHNGKICATFFAKSIFGQTCQCPIEFSEKSFSEIQAIAPDIHLTSRGGAAQRLM
jgi:hypothetical protein